MPTPVILDCDPGHDDVFAIWLAAANPEIDLRAITTVGGNGRLSHTTYNARVVTELAGITGVPISPGADAPLERPLSPAEWIHGANALGGPELPVPTVEADPRTAIELIRDTLDAPGEPVTIVATGPLTNLAQFVRAHPERLSRIREIVWMGGSTGRGNITPYAEFNAWTDPEAAAIVLGSGLRFTMIGLNVTHQALATREVIARIGAVGTRAAAFGVELLTFFNSTYEIDQGMPEGPVHDPVAMALVARPALVTTVPARIDIELRGTETAGATSVDLLNKLKRPPNAHVATGLDVEGFWDLIEDALRALS
ncbi:purine nucleosidase/pyrimidine-specific ribonucleoside hydrolase [Nonomuraea solani]|uniref:Purine nucleosidase/pyrimidine-specific ribonucleoside hydrolase n=1 Tax=Nonomuraea solani TaxID=1144553 RepID=A0A1H6EUU2_9ACTN|nr:nucleoside hydrolase [Nonomuraea solani]SEH01657.1 purine nucleosidase/pyrimidine-specific ribonucleoside hydrolase [Nonomuraea solani]